MAHTFIGRIVGLILVLAIFAGFGILGWHFVKGKILQEPEYLLSADKIVVSPPPDWVSDQFVEEVLGSSGLNKMSLLDKTLPQKLTEAFVAHPWVEKVEQVVPRYPSGADVKLTYRVPIALVELPQRGMVPVDRNGVALPSEYLSNTNSDRLSEHLIIQGIQSEPLGSVGTPWGDPMVQTAAQLAAALTNDEDNTVGTLKLRWIIPVTEAIPGGARIVCRLKTTAGTELYWGSFVPDDSDFDTKKGRLWYLYQQFRTLDNVPANFRDLSRQ